MKVDEQPDLVSDLLGVDISIVLTKISENDVKRRRFGWLIQMSECFSAGNTASSFCERFISVANDVMTHGRALLGDEVVEMLAVLRMNRHFMKMMKEQHGHLVNKLIENGIKEVQDLIATGRCNNNGHLPAGAEAM